MSVIPRGEGGGGCPIHGPECPPDCVMSLPEMEVAGATSLGEALGQASKMSSGLGGERVRLHFNGVKGLSDFVVQGDQVVGVMVNGQKFDESFKFGVDDLKNKPVNFVPEAQIPRTRIEDGTDEDDALRQRMIELSLPECRSYSVEHPGELVIAKMEEGDTDKRGAFINGKFLGVYEGKTS